MLDSFRLFAPRLRTAAPHFIQRQNDNGAVHFGGGPFGGVAGNCSRQAAPRERTHNENVDLVVSAKGGDGGAWFTLHQVNATFRNMSAAMPRNFADRGGVFLPDLVHIGIRGMTVHRGKR